MFVFFSDLWRDYTFLMDQCWLLLIKSTVFNFWLKNLLDHNSLNKNVKSYKTNTTVDVDLQVGKLDTHTAKQLQD